MAIVTETFMVGETPFTRTYSNAHRYVVREGVEYSEACDPASFGRTYVEGRLIPDDEHGDNVAETVLNIILGEEES